MAGHTMMMEWKPEHAGRWLFHCHFQDHISTDERVPNFTLASASPSLAPVQPTNQPQHDAMPTMNDMSGLVLTVNVKPAPTSVQRPAAEVAVHKLDLVIESTATSGQSRTFSCSVREGKKIVVSEDRAMGPPIVVTRGELTEITVLNHLDAPTTIHWHGLELDSITTASSAEGPATKSLPRSRQAEPSPLALLPIASERSLPYACTRSQSAHRRNLWRSHRARTRGAV
jgi:manganese oxidase